MSNEQATAEWTEGRVFAYFESEDFKGLADAINAALAAAYEKGHDDGYEQGHDNGELDAQRE
jgi:hypothetical protein